MTEEQVRQKFDDILNDPTTTRDQKYDLLHALDVEIQNKTSLGLASPTIREILWVQGQIVLKHDPA